jgi:hypothetical protein
MRVNHFGEVGALKAEVDIQWHFLFFESSPKKNECIKTTALTVLLLGAFL